MGMHDLTNILQRLEIMANLLIRKDFSEFSADEIREDVQKDLETLKLLFDKISNDQ